MADGSWLALPVRRTPTYEVRVRDSGDNGRLGDAGKSAGFS